MDNEDFEKSIRNIYPTELKLKKERQIYKTANFLDLNIKKQNSRFQANIYNKRDNFNLNIIGMASSNIPNKILILYLAISAEILRICKAIFGFQNFIKSAKILIGRIIKEGI